MKRIITAILSLFLAIPSFTAVCAADNGSELPAVPAEETLIEKKTLSDSRADVIALLWWAAGSPEPTLTENPFSDVSPDDPYYKAVLWAVENSITTGADTTHFLPNYTLTRGSALTHLYRAAGSPDVEPFDLPYRDVRSYDYYYSALLWAQNNPLVDVAAEGDRFNSSERLWELTAVKEGDSVRFIFHNHQWVTVPTADATCGSSGRIGRRCSVCGATVTEDAALFEHDFISYELAPTCTTGGFTRRFCKICGFVDYRPNMEGPLGHDYGADGKAERCSRCGLFNPALETSFADVPSGEFFTSPVKWAVQNGITTGTGHGIFSPKKGCTRGQVVTFLWRAAGCPEPSGSSSPFGDVKEDDYFYSAVLWAVENDITKGTSASEFSPDKTCTRGQIVTFLWRAAGSPEAETAENPFRDVKDGDYFLQAVLWAVKGEITFGTSQTAFSPSGECTRAQVVTFLYRYLAPLGFFYGDVYVNDWMGIAFPVAGYDAAIEPFDVGGTLRGVFWADDGENNTLEISYVYSKRVDALSTEMTDEEILDLFIGSFKDTVKAAKTDDLIFEYESDVSTSRGSFEKECVVEANGEYYHCAVIFFTVEDHLVLILGTGMSPDLGSLTNPVNAICFR